MQSFIHTNNSSDIRLVAAVGAMGILCEADDKNASSLALSTKNGVIRTWLMSQTSNCGNWKLSDLLNWWKDREFHVKNGDNPFNRVKCVMASKKAMTSAIKSGDGLYAMRRGLSLVFATQPPKDLAKRFFGFRGTDDTDKVAAFLAMGFDCQESPPVGNRRMFQIPNASSTGAMTHEIAEAIWNDSKFHEKHPDHAFSYVKCALANYSYLVSAIKRDKPLIEICKGESFAYLHPDCSSETEGKIMRQFNQ